jgi:uncharacterized GH25 family protein
MVVMESKGAFGGHTDEGFEYKSKKELKGKKVKGDIKYYENFCKAVVKAGESAEGDVFSKVLGHGLEIVPLKNPSTMRTNDVLPLRVLHNGKPLDESVMVYATYMGFSNEADVFAYTAWASKSRKGVADIRLLQPGIWMIFVEHELPYPDTKMADRYGYQATLTFEVQP